MRVIPPPPPPPTEVRRRADELLRSLSSPSPSAEGTPEADRFVVADATFTRWTQAQAAPATGRDPLEEALRRPDDLPATLAAEELVERFSREAATDAQGPGLQWLVNRLRQFVIQPNAVLERAQLLRAVLVALSRKNPVLSETTAAQMRRLLQREAIAPVEAVLEQFAPPDPLEPKDLVSAPQKAPDQGAREHDGAAATDLRVDEVMSRELYVVAPDTPLPAVKEQMDRLRIRHVPVVSGGVLCGIVTSRDVLLRSRLGALGDVSVDNVTVLDAMSGQPLSCRPETLVRDAAATLLVHHFDCLPVVDPAGRLLGLLTASDLLRLLAPVPKSG